MEVEYLIERLGPYLGGIDVKKVKSVLYKKSAASRILGVEEIEEELGVLECRKVKTFLEMYKAEEKELDVLYREVKSVGVSPSDMTALLRRVRDVRRRVKIYRELLKRCQGRSVSSHVQTPEFTSRW